MTAVRLAMLELRRFRGRPLRYLAVLTIVAVPLLYGTLHLWSNWDPYRALDRVPVAVVNADTGTVIDGHRVNAGQRLVDQLTATNDLDWHFVDRDEATRGMTDGDYVASVLVPDDFSAGLAPGAKPNPEPPAVTIQYDPSHDHPAMSIADTIRTRLHHQINTAVYATLATTTYPDLNGHRDALRHVRDAAGVIQSDATETATDAEALAAELNALETASRSVADGVNRINNPVQNAYAVLIDDLDTIQAGSEAGAAVTAVAATELGDIHAALCGDRTDDPACESLAALADRARTAEPAVADADAIVQGMSGADLGRNAAQVQRLADGATHVADDTATVSRDATQLATATGDADTATGELAAAIGVVTTTLPTTDPAVDGAHADTLGSPVGLRDNASPTTTAPGRGLAPYVVALALWVFALVAYMVLRTVNPRALAGDVSALTVALAGWLPAVFLGVVGAVALYFAVDVGLGLDAANAGATVLLCVLAVAVFTAIAHALRLALPTAGDVVMVVLLMLQLTSVGGIYPLSTAPGFFQWISPYLPVTYLVDGLRVTIGGGGGQLWWDVAVLALFGVAALTASTLTTMRHRRWTIARLHPAID
ncbi:YhgE/Pip domain-containing protein [Stackebrandtia soli]|uniref:YhgE/Pip domain-containing protein n=1 Tax=Stackebrandtia soli TaxID=1892856 RepID=UPI0039EB35CD